MNNLCEQFDLKAYAIGEASAAERKTIEGHTAACSACRTELDSLGTLHVALRTWADEEPPRRIAFVSDKVFEPTPWQRWFATLNPANLLTSAALAGLVAFAVGRMPRPEQHVIVAGGTIETVAQTPETIDLATRVDNAVKAALAESERRHQEETTQLIRATEHRMRSESAQATQQTIAIMESNFEVMRKHEARILRASADPVNFQ